MQPFKVFDRKNKTTWLVLNYCNDSNGGKYLAACEENSTKDGKITLLTTNDLLKMRFLDFLNIETNNDAME